jgi:lipopolysaccharide/colanic/teichoic acid biosynthesis glycosyltransferase
LTDIVGSSVGLALTLPLYPVIAAAIWLESPGSVFIRQRRAGQLRDTAPHGDGLPRPQFRHFTMFKFRSMRPDAEKYTGPVLATEKDPRITRVGRFLRKTRLDELPQFINVLRGEMSIVGPRPPIASEVEKYELEHFRRLEVLPGLTGLWQIQARQDSSFAKYIALDTAYVENWSFWLDLKILVRTAEVVVRGTGT